MAERSMAVVLKTYSGQILCDLADPRSNTDNRSAKFRPYVVDLRHVSRGV